MKQSLNGHQLPESFDEAQSLAQGRRLKFTHCEDCKLPLSNRQAAYSTAGWRETQISGLCEPCFDCTLKENFGAA